MINGGIVDHPEVNNFGPPPLRVTFSGLRSEGPPGPNGYRQAFTVFTNVDWSPVLLNVDCDGIITDISLDGTVFDYRRSGNDVSWSSPGISPRSPKTIYLSSPSPLTTCNIVAK